MNTLIVNAHIISPDLEIPGGAVEVEKGRIKRVFRPGEPLPGNCRILDARDNLTVPGFIDIHTHGAGGADFCDGTPAAVEKVAECKAGQGVTGLLATTLTLPEATLTAALTSVRRYMDAPTGAEIFGIHLEGPFIAAECAGAQNADFLKAPDIALVDRLNAICPIRKLSYSIELDPECGFLAQLLERGIVPSAAHSAASYEAFAAAHRLGLRNFSHFCNVLTPLHHLRFGLVGAGLLHDDVDTELICDGVHLCDEMIRLLFKVRPIERLLLITDSMRACGMPDGEYSLGGLPVAVHGGCARLATGQVAGSTLNYPEGLRRVARLTGLPLPQLIQTTSYNQARSLGLRDRGKIEPGFAADIAVLTPGDFAVKMTMAGGRVVKGSD